MIHKKVKFNGEIYWLHGPYFGDSYNISPLDHYNENGELLANPSVDLSYAIMLNDEILRYGGVIGTASDLIDVE